MLPGMLHSGQYLFKKEELLRQDSVTIIGSGQSAAEIFYDLLKQKRKEQQLHWFTRSDRFYPMEYSKLTLEMTSMDYIDHFYALAPAKKKEVLCRQHMLYKGINFSLINEIYDHLYLMALEEDTKNISICANTELRDVEAVDKGIQLHCYHLEAEQHFYHSTGAVILATGYRQQLPDFIGSLTNRIAIENNQYQVNKNYSIDCNGREIFVQNAELHTHGFSAPDLGMGPYRNAIILNTILGYNHFHLETSTTFQSFTPSQIFEP
jgi:lysine N6-hydroxylase